MTERVQKAIDIFLDAINKGTLAKGTCVACAVGNLVAYGKGGQIFKNPLGNFECTIDNSYWGYLFSTSSGIQTKYQTMKHEQNILEDISATDFTLEELMKIEYAFETNTSLSFDRYHYYAPDYVRLDQIKGLAAVVKVMLSFDSTEPVENSEVYEVFTSKAELIPLNH